MIDFIVYSVTITSIWAVLALSLNIQFGLAGLVNFGQVLPFAVGAYAAGIAHHQGLPWWLGVAAGVSLAPVVGIVVIFPARRLASDYWALVTLGAGEIFRLTVLNFRSLAGGVEGTSVVRLPDRLLAMALSVALLIAAFAVAERISRAPLGRILRVIREDETLAASLGRNPFHFQCVAMTVSWIMAGAAGALYAHIAGFVHPSTFMVIETFVIWTAVILGGPGRNIGVVLGAVVIQLLGVSTRFVAQWTGLPSDLVANLRLALVGLLLVLMVVYRPRGLIPERKRDYDAQDRRY